MMKYFWKKTLWAALLTAAFALTATGCGDSDTQSSTSSAAVAESSAAAGDAAASSSSGTASADGSFTYQALEDGTISITGYSGTETALNVPASIDSYVVSAIEAHAFEANRDLVSITLPNGLTEIGESAFMDCTALTSIQVPETVAQVDRAAFAGCTALTTVTLPESVTTVMEEAFTGCTSLTSLTVANASLEYTSWGIIEGTAPLAVTITCPSGSSIEAWATENGISTQALQ